MSRFWRIEFKVELKQVRIFIKIKIFLVKKQLEIFLYKNFFLFFYFLFLFLFFYFFAFVSVSRIDPSKISHEYINILYDYSKNILTYILQFFVI